MRLFFRFAAFVVLLPMIAVAADECTPGDLYILAIGIEPDLTKKGERDPYAGDAEFVSKAMTQAGTPFTKTHRKILTGKDASRANVLKALGSLIETVEQDDLAVIFFSAHGDMHGSNGYAIDLADSDAKTASRLWGSELNDILAQIRGRTLLLLDTCNAGGVLQGAKPKPDRIGVLAACKADEESDGQWQRADRPHGWFVIALCEALAGLADNDHDGSVTLAEVATYLAPRARSLYKQQNAVFDSAATVSKIPLTRCDRTQKPTVLWP
jgi:hypothetical protein